VTPPGARNCERRKLRGDICAGRERRNQKKIEKFRLLLNKLSESDGCKFEFLAELFWVVDSSID